MKRIVVPTDFSNLSRSAALYAIDLAAKTNARIMIVSVIEIEPNSSQLANWRMIQDQLEHYAAQQSARFMQELHSYSNSVRVSYTKLHGSPIQDKILEFARVNNADLIVTGTKGASGLKAVMIGSNTAALINQSDIPILAVPGDIKFNGFDRIVLATDMNDLDKEAKSVVRFAKDFDVQVDILHVTDVHREQRKHGELEAILRRMTGHTKLNIHVVTSDNVITALNQYIKQNGTDLLVMFTHKLGMFEKLFGKGHTREMAFQSEIPLLTFKKSA